MTPEEPRRTFAAPPRGRRETYDEVTARMEGKLFAPAPLRNPPEQRPAGDVRTSFKFPNQQGEIEAGTIAELLARVAILESRLNNLTATGEADLTLNCDTSPPTITGTIDITISTEAP